MNAFASRASVTAVAAVAILLCASSAFAATFEDVADFGEPGLKAAGSISVRDHNVQPWRHDISDDVRGLPNKATITSAVLTVSFGGTDGNETWTLAADGIDLGALPASSSLATHEIPLSAEAIDALSKDGQLEVTLSEATGHRDGIRLYEAKLSGQYEPASKQSQAATEPRVNSGS